MRRALWVFLVMLGWLAGPMLLAQESHRIEAGKRIGPVSLGMPHDEVVRHLGTPDRLDAYPSGQPDRYFYDGVGLKIQFNHPIGDDPSSVYMIHTTSDRSLGVDGVTIGSSSAEVARAYGDNYERVEGEGFWAMFYDALGIRFEFASGSDLVSRIGVFHPSG